MKKKTAWIIFLIFISCGAIYLFKSIPSTRGPVHSTLGKETLLTPFSNGKNERTDGPERLARHEYLTALDPATKQVPVERLKMAEDMLESQTLAGRVMSSNIVWEERGPSNIGGRTRAILIDKSDGTGNTVWAGGTSGGLWKTTNFKTTSTWVQVAGISANMVITAIAQDPSALGTIYVGTGEGFFNIDAIRGLGVFRTTNGGTSWTLLPSTTTGGSSVNNFYYVNKLLVYTNGDVYAATRSNFCNTGGGIIKSVDGGTNWTRVIGTSGASCAASADAYGYDIEKSFSGDLYAATQTPGSTGKIWKSPAGATVGNSGTWSNVTPTGTFQRIELACSPTNNLKLYALTQGAGSSTGGTRLSIDGGATWSNVNVGTWCDQGSSNADFTRGQAWYDLILGIKPTDDATVYAGGIDIFKTTNSGTAWTQISQWATGCSSLPYVHADIHAIEFFPGSPDEFLVGCDGGLFYTTNGGTTFTNKNSGYNITQYYSGAIHPTSGSNYLLGGAQDNGSHKFTAAGVNAVTTVTGGDGGFCDISSANGLNQFTSFTGATFNRSLNGGTSFTYLGQVSADRFINPSEYDASTDIIYCGGVVRNFYRVSTMTGTPTVNTFSNVASSANHSVSAIKVDPTTPNRVWVAFSTADGAGALVAPELYRVDGANGGSPVTTAITLPAGIAASGNYISSIDIETGNSAHVIVSLSNYGVNNVWETTNTGGAWTSIENGSSLPDIPVRWCKFMPAGLSPNTRVEAVGGVLLATDLGVWSTNAIAGGPTVWVVNNTGMGNVRTDMIRIRAADNKIVVATHGRGMFTGTHLSALPVTLTVFKGTLQANKTALLQWTTSAEYNSKHFELEKSLNGIDFRRIGIITAAGNSNTERQYEYTDREPLTEKNYYRLKSVDINNESKFSNIVLLKIPDAKQDMLVMGNPFTDKITIRFIKEPQGIIDLKIMNMNGQLILRRQSGKGAQIMDIAIPPGVSRGNYLLHAMVDGHDYTATVIKQ